MEETTKKLTSIRENRKTRRDAQLKKVEADRAAAVANAAILEAAINGSETSINESNDKSPTP